MERFVKEAESIFLKAIDKYPEDGVQLTLFVPGLGYWTACHGKSKAGAAAKIEQNTLFGVGSVTKLLTAVLVMKFQEEGKLKISEKISNYLSSTIDFADLTTKDFLSQTTGLPDYAKDENFWSKCYKDLNKVYSEDEIIECILKSEVTSKKGEFQYNGSNYYILGMLLKKLCTTDSLAEVFRKHLFTPLKLSNSFLPVEEALPDTFSVACKEIKNAKSVYSGAGAGGAVVSNTLDLAKCMHALFNSKILSEDSLNEMLECNKENYGLGIQKIPLADGFVYGHDGCIPETSGMAFYDPETKICGSLLTTNIEKQYVCWDVIESVYSYFKDNIND